jgi:hypothetical protein
VKIPTKVKKFRYTVKRTSYESTGGNSYVAATPEVTRYDMIVDRKTGAVQLVPIVEKKRRK